jgi:hypothetical protein
MERAPLVLAELKAQIEAASRTALPSSPLGKECVAVVWLVRFSGEIEGVVAEAVDVLGEVGADGGDGLFRHSFSALFQVLDKPGQ